MAEATPVLRAAGADALILYLGDADDPRTFDRVQAAARVIEESLGQDLVDLVPSYTSVLILFDPLGTTHHAVARRVRRVLDDEVADALPGREVTLPVWYDPQAGEDLEAVAGRAGLSPETLIELHSGVLYRVYAIGFAPGFAYLGEVDARIAAPRLATPRVRVPRGSVGIADRQTAVYPAPSPGGWNLIGRCPVLMFDPGAQPPMPVAVGDRVRFEAIDRAEYLSLGGSLS